MLPYKIFAGFLSLTARVILTILPVVIFLFSASAQKLVLPGDYPDPSVVKIGDTYWASATSSNWFPAYPLLHSKDLVNWQTSGYIFNQKPEWADYYFWAPEMTYDKGKVYVYYAAHKKGGNLCVGVASADKPEGPYKDHGPLICEAAGSIDAFPMRDESGKLFLIWKEDGNSVKKPTPIWIQEMNEERTALMGEKKELFRNDAPWEANLVEGVSMIKHNGYIYAIYAAAGCCGPGCTYTTGVARATNLMGPWEKDPGNPVLTGTDEWKCPGHGTAVEKNGKFYFLYHAYNTESDVFTGRQGLLSEFTFTPEGWINFVKQPEAENKPESVIDEFRGRALSSKWQWNIFHNINAKVKNGYLKLSALPTATGSFLGQTVLTGKYRASAVILRKKSTAQPGIGILGDEKNTISAMYKGDSIQVVVVKDCQPTIVASQKVSGSKKLYLKADVTGGYNIIFSYSTTGLNYSVLNKIPLNGSFLPPWDRGLRVGPVAKGPENLRAVLDEFRIEY